MSDLPVSSPSPRFFHRGRGSGVAPAPRWGRAPGVLSLWLLPLLTVATAGAAPHQQRFDILIENGMVHDGSGNPAVAVDIGIVGDTIVAIGALEGAAADRVIDAAGLQVAPGFIDMHSHADRAFASDRIQARRAPNLVTQGITTVVFGADGRNTTWPLSAEIAAFRDPGVAINVVPMVGHGRVRQEVMGDDFQRPASADEIERMRALVREGMEEGAWGIGAGPEYSPGRWSTTEELVELGRVVAEYDGFYYAHQRSQARLPLFQLPSTVDGPTWDGIDGLNETISIGREAGIRVVGSHVKAKGRSSWGRSYMDTKLIELARAEGVQVYLDHYPYETNNGGAQTVFPAWALEGGAAELQARLDDPQVRATLLIDLEHMIDQGGGPGRLIITDSIDPSMIGKSVQQVARERGVAMTDLMVDLALQGERGNRAGIRIRPLSMHEYDNDQYIRQDYTATSTDAGVDTEPGGASGPHPRTWGAFPRKIAHYVKERGVISLPFALRSMSGLGAQIIGLTDRGYLREGYKADIVVFSFEEIHDNATIMAPGEPSDGVYHVLVNGLSVMADGELTGLLPGQVLLRGR